MSVSLAFGPHSFASTVNATVWGWPSGSAVCLTPMLFPIKALFSLPLTISVQRITLMSVSLAFGPHSFASTVNATVWGWPARSAVCLTPMLFPIKALFSLPLTISVQRITLMSVSLAFGPHSFASTVNATVWGWPARSAVCLTPMLFPIKALFSLPLTISVQRITLMSVSLAFGPHSFASTVNATVWGWPARSAVCLTPMLFPIKALFSLPLTISVQRITLMSVSLAFGPHSFASTVNATVWGWPARSAVCLTPMLFPIKALFSLPLTISVQRITLMSVSLAFGPHSFASTVNATVWGWPARSTVCFTPILFPIKYSILFPCLFQSKE